MADQYDTIPSSLRDFIIDNIQLDKQIGRGANGRILEAKWEGIIVAVKEIHSIFINDVSEAEFLAFKRSFLRECEQSSRLCHPNIVRFFGIYYPPGAKAPRLVMERLRFSLTNLLEQDPALPVETKLLIIHDVALGLRYLHTRTPIIIHRDLSSNNVLISKGMEGKIGDLGTARLVDPTRQSRMTKAPGTVDFMPPEALAASGSIQYDRELDVFSFGCVMLHTLSHQWPTPSEPVVIDPVTFEMKGKSEVERRSSYFDKIDKYGLSVLMPMVKACLNNIPKKRSSVMQICSQLEGLVNKQHSSVDYCDLPLCNLQQEVERKDAEIRKMEDEIRKKDAEIYKRDTQIHNKDIQIQQQATEIKALKSDMAKLQMQLETHDPVFKKATLLSRQVSNSSNDFWNSLKLTWQNCANLPVKCWVTSVAELDGKVYVTAQDYKFKHIDILMYDCYKDEWSALPKLCNEHFSLVAIPCKKQLLAIGGRTKNEVSDKVFAWDKDKKRWTTPYPNMPTARCKSSCISHGSAVIVAGGLTNLIPRTLTRAVEILHIEGKSSWLSRPHWVVVTQLPHPVQEPISLIINNDLYIAVGFDDNYESTCTIVTASLPKLLQSNVKSTGAVWNKLPDMPYSSWSINYYEGHLIVFTGDHRVEQPGQNSSTWKLISFIHLYNPVTKSWDHVDEVPFNYLIGKSVHIRENKLLFVAGQTGTHMIDKIDDMVATCLTLTFAPK